MGCIGEQFARLRPRATLTTPNAFIGLSPDGFVIHPSGAWGVFAVQGSTLNSLVADPTAEVLDILLAEIRFKRRDTLHSMSQGKANRSG